MKHIIFLLMLMSIQTCKGQNEKKIRVSNKVEDILSGYNINSSNILYKNKIDFDNNGKGDYVLVCKKDGSNTNDLLIIKNDNAGYSVVLENNDAIPCEDCGNGAESFYDYRVDGKSLSFTSSYKSNEDIYMIEYEFTADVKSIYVLNKATVNKSRMGESLDTKAILNNKNFGIIALKDFNYSSFLSKYILNKD